MTEVGLCRICRKGRAITSARGSVFWRCLEHDRDPQWPKYPGLPVLHCERHLPQEAPTGLPD